MKLTIALKQKNRLAGELARLQQILHRENERRNDNLSKVNPGDVWERIIETSEKLGVIKAAIAKANVPIYSKIERMGELKSRISFITSLPKREEPEVIFIGRDQEKLTYTWTSFINAEKADALVAKLQEEIDSLQDEIDEFNGSTEIHI